MPGRAYLMASMLNFATDWRFEAPGEGVPREAVHKFSELIFRIAGQGDRWTILEFFKTYFAGAAGRISGRSSSQSWAESDLENFMHEAAANAPMFIEAFYDACQKLRELHPEYGLPDVARINRVLGENEVGFEIRLPYLVLTGSFVPISVPERPVSLDEQAQELIQTSLKESERFLVEGRHRQAVTEVLWLLETVTTAFRGIETGAGTVQEKYFTRIAQELRRQHKGQILEQVLIWVSTLHGFLSSPTGGGVRHGTDINNAVEISSGEARLYCNLIRSYIVFLMTEHGRISHG